MKLFYKTYILYRVFLYRNLILEDGD